MSPDTLEDRTARSCSDPVTGRPRLLSAQCSTCIGNPANLPQARLLQLVRDALQDGSHGIICQETLTRRPALCRWFWDTYGYRVKFFGVTARGGGWTLVDPPASAGSPDDR
jgi:hypothetical protein